MVISQVDTTLGGFTFDGIYREANFFTVLLKAGKSLTFQRMTENHPHLHHTLPALQTLLVHWHLDPLTQSPHLIRSEQFG